MKKRILSVVLVVIMILTFPVISNAASPKTSVNKTIKSYFEAMKKFDTKKMDNYIYRKKDKYGSASEMKKETPNMYQYIKKYNKKISYKIISTKVKGQNAEVKVKVKYVDSEPVAGMLLLIMLSDAFSDVDMDSDDYVDKAWKRAEKLALEEYGKLGTKSKTITINMIKTKGKWKIKKVPASLANVAVADIGDAFAALAESMNE